MTLTMKPTFKPIISALLASLITACAFNSNAPAAHTEVALSKQEANFFKRLESMCGETLVGTTVYPDDPSHDFAGKKLIATISECSDRIIRIPFTVGDDKSRTWIIKATGQGLLFKHDHRYPNGKPHAVTNYGGYAGSYKNAHGTETKQFFIADEHTADMIPEAKSNVWMLELKPETNELIYYLERHQKPRYKAVLTLQN
ncbi:hypothetical protein [Kangiella marina]|uniref:Uncharacterized protein n=1 Tax=Kangiella marina TaxID=1079178 RepID=A0ABP8IPT0_9GAMM